MITLFDSIILGIVEGITEFLPISSTGHLMITSRLLNITPSTFSTTFEIAIQSGAILAVILLYSRRITSHKELIPKIAFAFLPTLIAGLVLYPFVKAHLLENVFIVFYALIIGGILMLLIEKFSKNSPDRPLESLTYKESFYLGSLQILALIPGVSRSGATIIGGMGFSLPRTFLVEFSFLLAIPTILGATIYDLYKSHSSIAKEDVGILLVGMFTSAIVAYIVMKKLLSFLKNHTFVSFAWYRIIIGVIGYLYFS